MMELNEQNYERAISNGITVVDFWTEWCGPCKMLSPTIDALSKEITGVKFAKVDGDREARLAMAVGVQSVPTIIVYKDGVEIVRNSGFINKSGLKRLIDKATCIQ